VNRKRTKRDQMVSFIIDFIGNSLKLVYSGARGREFETPRSDHHLVRNPGHRRTVWRTVTSSGYFAATCRQRERPTRTRRRIGGGLLPFCCGFKIPEIPAKRSV